MNKKKLPLLLASTLMLFSCGESIQSIVPEGEEIPVATANARFAKASEAMKDQKGISINIKDAHYTEKTGLSMNVSGISEPSSMTASSEASYSGLSASLAYAVGEDGSVEGHLKASANVTYKVSAASSDAESIPSVDFSGSFAIAAYIQAGYVYCDFSSLASIPGAQSSLAKKYKFPLNMGQNPVESLDFSSLFDELKDALGKGEETAIEGKDGSYSFVYKVDPVEAAKEAMKEFGDNSTSYTFTAKGDPFYNLVLTFDDEGFKRLGVETSFDVDASFSTKIGDIALDYSGRVASSSRIVADFAYDSNVEVDPVPNPEDFADVAD